MYTDDDLWTAVKAGVLDEQSVVAFRRHMAQIRHTQAADEENFRLLSGFNDIFVTVAALLFLISCAWLAGSMGKSLGFWVAAGLAWGLSVYFVQRRKLALPAILLLLAYIVGVLGGLQTALTHQGLPEEWATMWACAGTVGMTWLHWRTFKVPITVAAGMACLSGVLISMVSIRFPEAKQHLSSIVLICGLMAFAVAMYWDAQDTSRTSRKSDVAFWLHLIASPLIVHSVFSLLDATRGDLSIGTILIVIGVYVLLGLVSIAIDRRALMVSALVYVIYAMATLFQSYGAGDSGLAISGVFIGAMLLFLSAAWHPVRSRLLQGLPIALTRFVPSAK